MRPDPDDDDEEIDIYENDEYPWAESNEERRRAFIFYNTAGELSIEAMEKIERWLKGEKVVPPPRLIPISKDS